MAMKFSPDQISIIDSREQNVLVSAAAGSGKTSVLTERIVGRVADAKNPIDIDKMLVVTFTNAAAREMKERIGLRLNELILSKPEDRRLQKQATLIHGALITTIDSFCLYLVRNHFQEIGIDPAFRIAGEGESKLLKEDVLKDVIKRAYGSKDETFYHIIDCYSKKDKDDSLEGAIKKLFDYAMSYPWPKQWLEQQRDSYKIESEEALNNGELFKSLKETAIRELGQHIQTFEAVMGLCLEPGGPSVYEDNLKQDIELTNSLSEFIKAAKTYREIMDYYTKVSFASMTTKKCDCDPDYRKKVAKYRNDCKAAVLDLGTSLFSLEPEELLEQMNATNEVVNKLIDLVEDFIDSFDKEKRNRGMIDFSDMEHMAVQILVKNYNSDGTYEVTEVAKSYRDYFEEVMVDEYQDSNMVQELIIQSVSREYAGGVKNRFMVGDVKQSIYRFRLARPEIFMGKMGAYKKDPSATDRLITLKSNYRSRESVINSVNQVFEKVMTKDLSGIEYDADARLYKGANYTPDEEAHKTEVILIDKTLKSKEAREAEAEAIAQKILALKGTQPLYNVKTEKAGTASYRDMAVLFRSPSKWRKALKDAFEKYGIPYHMEGVGAFYDTREISEIICFLRVLNNPLDDISLYASMTSSFGKMTDEECAYIKYKGGNDLRSLWERVELFSEEEDHEKVKNFVALVKRYRTLSRVLPIHELIERLFNETGYRHIVAAMPSGTQRLANVNMLVTKASEYAKTSFYGLFHFLRYIELMKKIDEDEGEANTFDESADVVRIMSIHKSKGLEFPVTFVAGIDETFNDMDLKASFVTDIDTGIGASFVDPEKRIKRDTVKKNQMIKKLRQENIGEEIRTLYVALTRAKEKLILIGYADAPKDYINNGFSAGKNSYISLMLPAFKENKNHCFNFTYTTVEDILAAAVEKDLNKQEAEIDFTNNLENTDAALLEKLRDRFSFAYPHAGLAELYTKTTVSELKMAAIEIEREEDETFKPFEENESKEYIPVFAGGETEVKGTDRGTAYHNLMELLDFKAFLKCEGDAFIKQELERQIGKLIESEAMSEQDVEKINRGKILAFLNSETAVKCMEADAKGQLYKEQPFVIGVPASEVDDKFPKEEILLVQGVIDLYYVVEGRVTVLDYKTDRVDSGEELVKRYRKQLEYYSKAIRQLTGLETNPPLIYSFGLNATFVVQ